MSGSKSTHPRTDMRYTTFQNFLNLYHQEKEKKRKEPNYNLGYMTQYNKTIYQGIRTLTKIGRAVLAPLRIVLPVIAFA
jgi:hypothetical protein